MKVAASLNQSLCKALAFGLLGIAWCSPTFAKEPTLTAIELYDGTSGAAYVQLSDVLINGKVEMRDCTSVATAPMDKSTYNKLEKITLAVDGILDRGADGVLRYSVPGAPAICVVPENVKFEHNATYSPAAMTDGIQFRGNPIAPASDGSSAAQPLSKGVKLVIVAAPNLELAEFLLAQRSTTIAGWLGYLAKYPASPHSDEAKTASAILHVGAGEKTLTAYDKSSLTDAPSYSDLKAAKSQEVLAHGLRPDLDSSVKLASEIRTRLDALTDKGRAELDAYNAALTAHTGGYVHLHTAETLAEAVTSVDAAFAPGQKLQIDVAQARNAFDSALRSASSAAGAKQMDDALQFVVPYRAFAEEEPRVAQVIDATYKYHYEQAKQAEAGQDWKTSIEEYKKAANAKDTAEARDSLKNAQEKYAVAQDEAAAKAALDKSRNFETQKDMIDAYETLSGLTATQQAIVADDLKRLTPGYVQAASERAKSITKNYPNIQGIGDEREVEKAYLLLQRAAELSDEATKDGYKTRMENLGDELSAWFLDRAKHYFEKPAGSGTELGWAYLMEAQSYKAANLDQVRDQSKVAGPAHTMHSKLSIRVHFVDQTSLREATGFRQQLEDAIIGELQGPAHHAMPVRYGETTNEVEPDFQLEGTVLEHEITETPSAISKESHYRVGTHQEPNEAWNKANRDYEAAQRQLQSDQAALAGAETKGTNKKDITELNGKVAGDLKLVSDAEVKRDELPQNITKDDIRPYQYTVRTIEIRNRIKLQFRIARSGQTGDAVVVEKEDPSKYEQVADVKPDDIDGIKLKETTPNKTELQTALENTVRDLLIESVRAKIGELPQKVDEEARAREHEEDMDDAGEAFLRYLSVTPGDRSPDRVHAEQFLREQFNFATFPSVIP
jgi:hypothetical protein